MSIYWFIHTLAYTSVAVYVIPKEHWKRLWLFSFLGGFVYTLIAQYLAVNILEIWIFRRSIIDLFHIPFFFITSWTFVTLLYGYLLLRYSKCQFYIVLTFVAWTGITSYAAQVFGEVIHLDWNIWLTIMYAIFSHVLLLYVLKAMTGSDELGTKDDLLLLD